MIFLGQVRDGSFLGLRLTARGDPGVRSTTLMLTEAAICLAQDTDRIRVGGGFWTPAAAMGGLLRDRVVAHAGLSFEEMTDLAAPKSFR